MRKNKENWSKFEEKVRKVELLPTRDYKAGYGPVYFNVDCIVTITVLAVFVHKKKCVIIYHV